MGAVATVHYAGEKTDVKDDGNPPIEEAIANARLITAAPDMLAELQEILAFANDEGAPLGVLELGSIRRVVAKATGAA